MLEVSNENGILRVWLNRPNRLNALDTETLSDIYDVFTGLERDYSVRAVVLAGRGRAFCAGADRKDPPCVPVRDVGEREARWIKQIGLRACRAIADSEVVTIAQLHGHVIGGGVALAVNGDFRLASSDAVFSLPEIDLGLPLAWGAIARLVSEIGAARARELTIMADRISASTAERYGLINRVYEPDSIDDAVARFAMRVATKPAAAIDMIKTSFRALSSLPGETTHADGELFIEGFRSEVGKTNFAAIELR